MEQLLLSCGGLSPPALCRFIPALSLRPHPFRSHQCRLYLSPKLFKLIRNLGQYVPKIHSGFLRLLRQEPLIPPPFYVPVALTLKSSQSYYWFAALPIFVAGSRAQLHTSVYP